MPHLFRVAYCLLFTFWSGNYATLLSQNDAFFYYYDQKVPLSIAGDAVLVVLEGDVEKHARDLATEANGLVWQHTWRPVKSAVYTRYGTGNTQRPSTGRNLLCLCVRHQRRLEFALLCVGNFERQGLSM